MLLQTNSYNVPVEKRDDHDRLMRRFKHMLAKLGCDRFEVFEQCGTDFSRATATGRYVQMMWFRDKRHHDAVQQAERADAGAQSLIAEFASLVNLPAQQQQGTWMSGCYNATITAPEDRQQSVDKGQVAGG